MYRAHTVSVVMCLVCCKRGQVVKDGLCSSPPNDLDLGHMAAGASTSFPFFLLVRPFLFSVSPALVLQSFLVRHVSDENAAPIPSFVY